MMRRILGVAAPMAVAAVALAGCGSASKERTDAAQAQSVANKETSNNTPAGQSSPLSIAADPSGELKFNKSVLATKSGAVTIKMSNPSTISHGIAVTGNGVDKAGQTVNKGGTSTVSVTLKAGKYTFFCPVPGHRQAGMQGTLTVT